MPVVSALAAIAAAMALLPLLYLAIVVIGDPAGALRPLARGRVWTLLANSVLLAAAVTATTVALAVTLAWLIERTDVPGRRVWRVLAVLPLALPSYVAAYLLVSALGPRGEVVVQVLEPLTGLERLPSIYGFVAAWLTLSLVSYPYVLIPVAAALRGLDPALEEASRSLGHGPTRTLVRVVLPQLRPAIGAGALLVALYVLSDFGAVALSRYDTFTRAIFTSYKASFDRSGAAGLAVILVALTAMLVWLESRTRSRGALARAAGSAGRTPTPRPLGRLKWPTLLIVLVLLAATVALPLGMLLLWLVRAAGAAPDLGVLAFAAGRSMLAAGLAAAAATMIVLPITILSVRSRGRGARFAETAVYLGHALPGIVVALALVFLTLRAVPVLYQTLAALVLALALLYLPQALAPQRAALLQVSPRLAESARSLGARPLALLLRVQLPLMRRGLLAGAALVFLTAVKELPATLILAPPEFSTLSMQIWTATSTSAYEDAALPSLLLLLAGILPLAWGARQEVDR
jgi:iron(III) transport system permease protein